MFAHVQVFLNMIARINAWALYVFGDALCVVASNDLFFPITLLHTCGSFTFMVIQIMKLSIRGILWWEQWTQLPPAACEMGWQTLRQMGEAALGRQSNHIHLACFPFPLFMCSAATYQQAGAKEPGIITSHTTILQTLTYAHVHKQTPRGPLKLPPSPSVTRCWHARHVCLLLRTQCRTMILRAYFTCGRKRRM